MSDEIVTLELGGTDGAFNGVNGNTSGGLSATIWC